jgi:hypothetical protein
LEDESRPVRLPCAVIVSISKAEQKEPGKNGNSNGDFALEGKGIPNSH